MESINDSAFGRLAARVRQTGPDQWSRPFFVPVAYLEADAELAYAGNVHVAQGRTVDRGHLVVDSGADPQPGLHRGDPGPGEEHHPRGDRAAGPGAADPGRAGGLRRGAASAGAAALRKAGRPDLAREVPLRMPDRPSDLQLAPWEAVLAQALQQDEPERTALEEIQAAQDFTTHTGHLLPAAGRRSGGWTSCRRSTRWSASGSPPAEYERYLKDPERPAFLQALREHEIGGRRDPGPARRDHRRAADRAPQHRRRPSRQSGKRTSPGAGRDDRMG